MGIVKDKATVEEILSDVPLYERYVATIARLRRKAYVSLVAEGFSHDEAVLLCENLHL